MRFSRTSICPIPGKTALRAIRHLTCHFFTGIKGMMLPGKLEAKAIKPPPPCTPLTQPSLRWLNRAITTQAIALSSASVCGRKRRAANCYCSVRNKTNRALQQTWWPDVQNRSAISCSTTPAPAICSPNCVMPLNLNFRGGRPCPPHNSTPRKMILMLSNNRSGKENSIFNYIINSFLPKDILF